MAISFTSAVLVIVATLVLFLLLLTMALLLNQVYYTVQSAHKGKKVSKND